MLTLSTFALFFLALLMGIVGIILNYLMGSEITKMASRGFMGSGVAHLIRKVSVVETGVDRLPVYTLTFANPAGSQSLGVRMDHGDVIKVIIPGYKPKSYSMSDERPGEFDITFKVYPNGRCSGYLDRILPIGGEIEVFRKGSNRRQPGRCVSLIAFGVGITEALPITAAELSKPEAEHVHLIWSTRTFADTFWHDKIANLKEKFGSRFDISIVLSREEREGFHFGRITTEKLDSLLRDAWVKIPNFDPSDVRFLTVGTKEMMREAEMMIAELGWPINSLRVIGKEFIPTLGGVGMLVLHWPS